jgi:hypothetical protein
MAVRSRIPVVYYHSVGPVIPHWHRSFLTISPEVFREQLEYLLKHYTIISLKELWLIKTGQAPPVKNSIAVTFDDGYSDIWTHAFPILRQYGVRATVFISPDFADGRDVVRSEHDKPGFLSWKEMKEMEKSGLIDIQSHTLSHTRYWKSGHLTGFHHPGGDILYPAINLFPERRLDHIGDPDFEKVLPYGFPLFEDGSAVTTRKISINRDFIDECISLLGKFDFEKYDFNEALGLVDPLYKSYTDVGSLVVSVESEDDYLERVKEEIYGSKKIIEERLGKKAEFLCWPHGDNNGFLHRMALEAGYLMTTIGKARGIAADDPTRIPERLAMNYTTPGKKKKSAMKLKALSGRFPYTILVKSFRAVRNS